MPPEGVALVRFLALFSVVRVKVLVDMLIVDPPLSGSCVLRPPTMFNRELNTFCDRASAFVAQSARSSTHHQKTVGVQLAQCDCGKEMVVPLLEAGEEAEVDDGKGRADQTVFKGKFDETSEQDVRALDSA